MKTPRESSAVGSTPHECALHSPPLTTLSASAPHLCSAHSSLSPGLPPSLAHVRELSLFCASRSLSPSFTSSEVQRGCAGGRLSADSESDHFALSFLRPRISLSDPSPPTLSPSFSLPPPSCPSPAQCAQEAHLADPAPACASRSCARSVAATTEGAHDMSSPMQLSSRSRPSHLPRPSPSLRPCYYLVPLPQR